MSQNVRKIVLAVALLIGIPLALFLGSRLLLGTADEQSLASAERSLRRAAVECYAIEGFYPTSPDYLYSRYGVSIDTSRYIVHYQYVASNLMPDVSVFALQ